MGMLCWGDYVDIFLKCFDHRQCSAIAIAAGAVSFCVALA